MSGDAFWLWTQRLARWVLGAVFIYAGAIKIVHPADFAQEIANYRLGSFYWLVHPAAIALPWIEVVVGLTLIFGLWVAESTLIITGLLLFFNFMVGLAFYRGLDISCGCFGGGSMKVGWRKLFENFGLIAIGIVAIIGHARVQRMRQRAVVTSEPAAANPSA